MGLPLSAARHPPFSMQRSGLLTGIISNEDQVSLELLVPIFATTLARLSENKTYAEVTDGWGCEENEKTSVILFLALKWGIGP